MDFLITLPELVAYCEATGGEDRVRMYVEGQNVFAAHHLIFCGQEKNDNLGVKIVALCLQTTDWDSYPHELILTQKKGKFKNLKVTCSCKAGSSECCKHCVALLLHISWYVLIDSVK